MLDYSLGWVDYLHAFSLHERFEGGQLELPRQSAARFSSVDLRWRVQY